MSVLHLHEAEARPPAERPSTGKWGTPAEIYRRLCMLALLARYAYYCHSFELVDEHTYNMMEKLIRVIEEKDRAVIDSRSPTFHVGSDKAEDYPRSVVWIWETHYSTQTLHVLVPVIQKFMTRCAEVWGVRLEAL